MTIEPFDNASLPDFSSTENLASFINSSDLVVGESDGVVANLQFLDGKYSKNKERSKMTVQPFKTYHRTKFKFPSLPSSLPA